MTDEKTTHEGEAQPRPTSLSAQLARQHELLMVQATKPARSGSQTMEWGERATGDKAGLLYLKSAVFVQHDDEEDVAFLGRQFASMEQADSLRNRFNADALSRQLADVDAAAAERRRSESDKAGTAKGQA